MDLEEFIEEKENEFLKERIEEVKDFWRVRSFSNPREYYTVVLYKNGRMSCECWDYLVHAKNPNYECKHIKKVKEFIGKNK